MTVVISLTCWWCAGDGTPGCHECLFKDTLLHHRAHFFISFKITFGLRSVSNEHRGCEYMYLCFLMLGTIGLMMSSLTSAPVFSSQDQRDVNAVGSSVPKVLDSFNLKHSKTKRLPEYWTAVWTDQEDPCWPCFNGTVLHVFFFCFC